MSLLSVDVSFTYPLFLFSLSLSLSLSLSFFKEFILISLLEWLTFVFPGMATMKENKGKEVEDEAIRQEVQS